VLATPFKVAILFSAFFFRCFCFGQSIALENPQELIAQLVDGNYGRPCTLTSLRLFQLESDFFNGLSKEVSLIAASNRLIKKFSLLNRSGRFTDSSLDHNWSVLAAKLSVQTYA